MLRWLRRVLLLLLLSFIVGVVIGTLLQRRLERPVEYIGEAGPACCGVARMQAIGAGFCFPA